MDATTKQPLTFEPPGPGPWDLDPVHFPRPVTAYWTEMHPAAFSLGYGDMMTFYGVPFQTRVTAYPNGFSYGQMVPVPPESFPDRVQRASDVFEGKLWREQATEWHEVRKPASVQAHHEIQSVDPDALSDDELLEYLRRCRAHHAAMIRQHMAFTGTAVIPPSDFLVHAAQWTGVPTITEIAMPGTGERVVKISNGNNSYCIRVPQASMGIDFYEAARHGKSTNCPR